jgi:hypothetical protein
MCSNEHDLNDRPEQHQIVWDCGRYETNLAHTAPRSVRQQEHTCVPVRQEPRLAPLSKLDLVLDFTLQPICRTIALTARE